MADLRPIPFPDLVRRMRNEVRVKESIFDLPVRKWFVPDGKLDLSAVHFSRKAGAPLGPAAGPHTQLAQNIVLAWLAGGRIMELKTVQVNDRLQIPRPCIHVPNVGFNVEWSQELRVGESLTEYAKAAFLIEILKETRGFGVFPSDAGFETIFDTSVGYDLDGIQSDGVTSFLRSLQAPAPVFQELRGQLTGDLREFSDLELPASISDCVTLSTFHGCPADQIESMARFLLEELGMHVILKLNPTLLGYDEVRHLLHGRMGYQHLELRREAFDADLRYEDGLEILRSLRSAAEELGSTVGAKFTNTLVVQNDPAIFPTQTEPYMYLSGAPLHVISMTLMQRFREELGFEFPVSFSAGIDAKNFPSAVACGMVPVTTCTDLLRQGGFGRLPAYLRALGREMEECGVTTREAYVLAVGGNGVAAAREALEGLEGGAGLWERYRERIVSAAGGGVGERTGEGAGEPGGAGAADGAGEAGDSLPAVLREVADEAGLDGEALVLAATRIAGRLNGLAIVPGLPDDPRYHAARNLKPPRSVDSVLGLYDCLNCDLCVSACPNNAIFIYDTRPFSVETELVSPEVGEGPASGSGQGFSLATDHQIGVFQGACNECSNCEVYCPEVGAPFREKEKIFPTRMDFEISDEDGFLREDNRVFARLGGRGYDLIVRAPENRACLFMDDFTVELEWENLRVLATRGTGPDATLDTAVIWRMKTVWECIYHSARPNPVNPGGHPHLPPRTGL